MSKADRFAAARAAKAEATAALSEAKNAEAHTILAEDRGNLELKRKLAYCLKYKFDKRRDELVAEFKRDGGGSAPQSAFSYRA